MRLINYHITLEMKQCQVETKPKVSICIIVKDYRRNAKQYVGYGWYYYHASAEDQH
jgi:hypothetical protein